MTIAMLALSALSFYCIFGDIVTAANDKFANLFFMELNWYQSPSIVRKRFLLMMMITQKPFYLSGYGMISASRETLLTV